MMFFRTLILLLLFHGAQSIPLTQNDFLGNNSSALIDIPLVNASGLGNSGFSIGYQPGIHRINGLSAYMNALYFMHDQSFLESRGRFRQPIRVSAQPWNNVAVICSPVEGGPPLERRFVVLGLFESIYYLAQHEFRSGVFTLKWDGNEVGYVVYMPNPLPPGEFVDSSNQSIQAQIEDTPSTASRVLNGTASNSIEIDPSYLSRAKVLSIPGVFLPLAKALVFLGAFKPADQCGSFEALDANYHTSIYLQDHEGEMGAPPATVGNFIDAMWETAKFVVDRRRFAELKIEITVVGRLVGEAFLRSTRSASDVVTSL